MEDIKSNFGQLDAVLNCAGIAFAFRLYNSNKLKMADLDRFKKTLDVITIEWVLSLIICLGQCLWNR